MSASALDDTGGNRVVGRQVLMVAHAMGVFLKVATGLVQRLGARFDGIFRALLIFRSKQRFQNLFWDAWVGFDRIGGLQGGYIFLAIVVLLDTALYTSWFGRYPDRDSHRRPCLARCSA